jgi:hypothetical protein
MLRAEFHPIVRDLLNIAGALDIKSGDLGWLVRGAEIIAETPENTAGLLDTAMMLREKAADSGKEEVERRSIEATKKMFDLTTEGDQDLYRKKILEYQRGIMNYCLCSHVFSDLTTKIVDEFQKRKTKTFISHISNLLEVARKLIAPIYDMATGYLRRKIDVLVGKIQNFANIIEQKAESIIVWLREIYDALQETFHELMSAFVRFCQGVKEFFQKTGLTISEIELKLPELNVKITQIGPVPVPIFEASAPEITLTIGFS